MASGKNFRVVHLQARSRLRWLRYGDDRYRGSLGKMRRKISLSAKQPGKVKRVRLAAVQRTRSLSREALLREVATTAPPAHHRGPSKDVRHEDLPLAFASVNDLTASDAAGRCSRDKAVYSSRSRATVQGKVQTRRVAVHKPAAPPSCSSAHSPSVQDSINGANPVAVVKGISLVANGSVGQCNKEKRRPLERSKQLRVAAASSQLSRKLHGRMDAARFRWLNELLYTSTGSQAAGVFNNDPSLFDVYHKGFSEQVSQWPINPLDTVIQYIKGLPKNFVVADLGCGEGRLARSVNQVVHSFDLLSTKSHVTACDMAHVPLASQSVDVAVFCLSLMGINLGDYISEAWRVLRGGGRLKIIEVVSRIDNVGAFVKELEQFGFALLGQRQLSTMFVDMELKKTPKKNMNRAPLQLTLKPCLYKRR